MDEQTPASAQSLGQDAPSGPSPDASTPTASLHGPSGFASAPRGPHRAGVNGAGARSAAERFGLDWDSAAPAVRAVAAEACARVPEEWEIEGPGISLSLGDAADLDPALLEAMLGPDGLGGQALGPQFGQDAAADALRPGPDPGRADRAGRRRRRVPDRRPADRGDARRPAAADPRGLEADDAGRRVRPPPRRPARRGQGQRGPEGPPARGVPRRRARVRAADHPQPGRRADRGRPRAHRPPPAHLRRDGRRDHQRRPRRHDRRGDRVPVRRGRRPGG